MRLGHVRVRLAGSERRDDREDLSQLLLVLVHPVFAACPLPELALHFLTRLGPCEMISADAAGSTSADLLASLASVRS